MELTLQQLKEIAAKLNYNHSPNIGLETLKSKLEDYAIKLDTTLEEIVENMEFKTTDDISNKEYLEKITGFSTAELEKLSKINFSNNNISKIKNKNNEMLQNREAMKLVRVTITCNNKNKLNYKGEIFCVRNAFIPEVKKFVPFGVKTHIPQIMLNMIKEKEYQVFREETVNGHKTKKSILIPEFNIQIHPPITKEELEAIKKRQLVDNSDGE